MAKTAHTLEVESYAGVTLRHSLRGGGSKRLIVLLPGRGYTNNAPLLYYLRRVAWQHGDDVLSLSYGFHATQQAPDTSDMPKIQQETQNAIEQALRIGDYDDLVLVGKSMGTPIAAMLESQFPQIHKIILLTPIGNSHTLVGTIPTLAIIGTSDPAYDPDHITDNGTLTWQVYDGLNHGLEYEDDIQASIRIMGEIITTCEQFIYDNADS